MIYVASPYSVTPEAWYIAGASDDYIKGAMPALMEKRYRAAERYVHKKVKEGVCVFSPIVYSHSLAHTFNLPKTFEWWQKVNHSYMDACHGVHVLQMEDWDCSRGVIDEIQYAISKGLPIEYIEWEG